jgi:hypothetical protein
MDHDFYSFSSHFWWLIFPLFWMVAAIARLWSRHSRANRALDIVKSYADQGKDPPPELLKTLQYSPGDCGGRYWRRSPEERLGRAFLFAALACAFGFMAFWPQQYGDDPHRYMHHMFGLLLVTAVFVALALSNLMTFMLRRRDLPPDQDGRNR